MTTIKVSVNPTILNYEAQRNSYLQGLRDQAGGKAELRKYEALAKTLASRNGNLRSTNQQLRQEVSNLKAQLATANQLLKVLNTDVNSPAVHSGTTLAVPGQDYSVRTTSLAHA